MYLLYLCVCASVWIVLLSCCVTEQLAEFCERRRERMASRWCMSFSFFFVWFDFIEVLNFTFFLKWDDKCWLGFSRWGCCCWWWWWCCVGGGVTVSAGDDSEFRGSFMPVIFDLSAFLPESSSFLAFSFLFFFFIFVFLLASFPLTLLSLAWILKMEKARHRRSRSAASVEGQYLL